MNAVTLNSAAPPVASRGCDGAVVSREEDHLNRWPLAREIYGIATTGPKDWSVRIGIYGEWGTGKTSVLGFINTLAGPAGQIVVWFNPWQYSNKSELWRAFVLAVFHELESKLGQVPGADEARRKLWMDKAKGIVGAITGVVNDNAGKALDAGLELLKKHFAFSPDDLKSLQSILGEKRILVLIDDLDRTAPELVPEILFALKELTDIPGFSFICAFDPVVVGEVLRRFHPGFGDGLKFLEKIIDYPRWLPPPSTEGLTKLALSDAKECCNYVPKSAIRYAVPLLPGNPRAVRQFIRLLALLKPQIVRHYYEELRWPVIIAANVIKVRHPRIAHALLNDNQFWMSVGMIGPDSPGDNQADKLNQLIEEHIKRVTQKHGISLEIAQENELKASVAALCSQLGLFVGVDNESLKYQMHVAENPSAVTWKEFDAFLTQWVPDQVTRTAKEWIDNHARKVEQGSMDVYHELLDATVRRYAQVLHQADNVLTEAEKPALVSQAEYLFALLQCLVLDLGHLNQATKTIGDVELKTLVAEFASIARATMPVHSQFWPRNEAFLIKLFELWSPDVMPLVNVLHPFADGRLPPFDFPEAGELHKKLCEVLLPNFARQVLSGFHEAGFIERLILHPNENHELRSILLDVKGVLWSDLRSETFSILGEASSNRIVQENACQLLHWLVLVKTGHSSGDQTSIMKMLSDQATFDALWNAATAIPLSNRAVYNIRTLPNILQPLGTKFNPPAWWEPIVSSFRAPPPEPDAPDQAAPEPPDPADSAEDPS